MILENLFNKKSKKKRVSRIKTGSRKKPIKKRASKKHHGKSREDKLVHNPEKGVKKLIVKKVMSDDAIAEKEGMYFDESHYKKHNGVIDYDCDCYYIDDDGNEKLLIKFRKNVLPKDLCKIGMENLEKAAMKHHDNRGASAGILDPKKLPAYANDPKNFINRTKFRIAGYISKGTGKQVNNSLGNLAQSNIIGYFDRPDRNLGKGAPPCRTTAFTSQQANKWKKVLPLIKCIDNEFKRLIPYRYKTQFKRAKETTFNIKGTCFSTLTINYNWRTALHKDAGDFPQGFGNLVVLEKGKYNGGYTGFPQFGVCVDVREGDFLGMDVHEWHCNTKLKKITKDFSRVSLVAYLREDMIKCKGMKL